MSYNSAIFTYPSGGTIQVEISDDKEFMRRVKEINRDLKKRGITEPDWKYERVGGGRVPVDILRLFGQDVQAENRSANAGSTS